MGVRRQGLEPRTVALESRKAVLWTCCDGSTRILTWGSAYRSCPLVTPGCRSFAAPARPTVGHAEGMAGEHDVARSLPAMVVSLGDE